MVPWVRMGVVAAAIVLAVLLGFRPSAPAAPASTAAPAAPPPAAPPATPLVPPGKIIPDVPVDAIPPLDRPKYESAGAASAWLRDDDVVLGVNIGGARAYPVRILNWHEIVNEELGGAPVLVSYCPLCASAIVFDRRLPDGRPLSFGNTGALYNSQLVMYDRETRSQWSQTLGQAITGGLSGAKLKLLPSDMARWGDWKRVHPDTLALSRDTGYARDYGRDPFAGYDRTRTIPFPVENRDDRLHPKELVFGLLLDNRTRAYPLAELKRANVVNDRVGGEPVLVLWNESLGSAQFFRRAVGGQVPEFSLSGGALVDSGGSVWDSEGRATAGPLAGRSLEPLVAVYGFWFSWAAYHPDTGIFSPGPAGA